MNSNNNSNINWLNIISNNFFLNYLNINVLKELSLVSKIVRVKLSPKILHTIKIENNSQYVGRERVQNYNVRILTVLNNILCAGGKELNKRSYAEITLSDVKSELAKIKGFVSSLHLEKVNNFGYFLIPMFESFIDLTVLKLYQCTIPYSLLVNLGLSFPNLKDIELCDLLLVKLPTDIAGPSDLNIPRNLIYLKFGGAKVIEQGVLSNPYEILLKRFNHGLTHIFNLPKISIPSLKKLAFTKFSGIDLDLEEFLNLNTSLESLEIRTINLDRVYNLNSVKSLEVENVIFSESEPIFLIQKGIKELTTRVSHESQFYKVKKLCNLCPNLEKLKIIMPRAIYQDSNLNQFDSFLIPVLSNLSKLKTLVIDTNINERDTIDISVFPHIESVVFEIHNPCLNFKFNSHYSLKTIEIKCKLFELDNKKFIEEFNAMCSTYSNWRFKLFMGKIKGYKS